MMHISLSRISALMLRHIIPTFRDPIRITDMFYWPLVDITLFGFMASWAQEKMVDNAGFMLALVTCLACWYFVQRTTLEIARNLLMEIWDNHLINLLATPITLAELMLTFMALGVIQALITFVYSLGVIWLFYGQNVFAILPSLFPFMLLLIACGWIIGFLITALLFSFGKTLETLTWAVLWFFAILSGAFYPITLLPAWIQKVAYLFPATYLFEGIREMIINERAPGYYLAMGFALVVIHFIIAATVLKYCFARSKERGLSGLD